MAGRSTYAHPARQLAVVAAIIAFLASGLSASPATPAMAAESDNPTAGLVTEVTRISGADRYEVAVNLSRWTYKYGAGTVYIASGEKYPDALSAGPAAIVSDAVLLLTPGGFVPTSVAAEITRLKPRTIVVVGGEASISRAVFATLTTLAPTVERIGGADRYELSRAIARYAFPTAATAYLATGANFTDALSATPPAGMARGPVVLVDGGASSADAATMALLSDLRTSRIHIAGGPSSVSAGMEAQLSSTGRTVSRLAGPDRYTTAIAINKQAFTRSDAVFLASGTTFSDALSGGVVGGTFRNPLFLVQPDCIPAGVLSAIGDLGATRVIILGGPATLSANVERLGACP